MQNKDLQAIAETREITFDDILMVMDKACDEKLRRAIANSDLSAEDVVKKLTAEGCRNIYCCVQTRTRPPYEKCETSISCSVSFAKGEVDGISVVFERHAFITGDEKGFSVFSIGDGSIRFNPDFGNAIEICKLENWYDFFPETFAAKSYCD